MTLTKLPPNSKVAVVGAGVSGLTFAYFLTKLRPDVNVHIYEKRSRAGGWIDSQILHEVSGNGSILLEKGPRTLRGVSDGTLLIVDILKSLGKSDQVEVLEKSSVANKKYLLRDFSQLVQVPDSIGSLRKFLGYSGLLTRGFITGLLKEPFVKTKLGEKDETIESFFQRRFGTKIVTDKVLSAVLHGIYAGDVGRLSVRSILPKLVELENNTGSVLKSVWRKVKENSKNKANEKKVQLLPSLDSYQELISPNANLVSLAENLRKYPMIKLHNGLQEFPKAVEQYLSSLANVKIHYNSNITALNPREPSLTFQDGTTETYSHVRSTIYTHDLARLVIDETLQKPLQSVNYVSVFLANVYSKDVKLIPPGKHGFGFLVPKGNQKSESNPYGLLGVIFDSDVEQNVHKLNNNTEKKVESDYQKITLMMGGHFYDKRQIPSTSVNVKIVKNILADILHIDLTKTNLIIRDEAATDDKTVKLSDQDVLVSFSLHRNCIPQYEVGYAQSQAELSRVLDTEKYNFSIGGMAFGNGVGVPDCVLNALEGALQLK